MHSLRLDTQRNIWRCGFCDRTHILLVILVSRTRFPLVCPLCYHLLRLKAFFVLMGLASGCSRGVSEPMPEVPVNLNTFPFGEDYDALTISEGSGAAVLLTLHTHPP